MVDAIEKSSPGMLGGIMCRKRYIDEKVAETRNEIEAVVDLGAGFDTRAYRIPALHDMPIWEVDQAAVIKAKETRIRKVFGTIPSHVNFVAVDFESEDVGKVLTSHGYSLGMVTFFIWEGVTQYLTESSVRATFSFLANVAQGSRLAFTYVRKDFLDGCAMYGWEKGYRDFVKTRLWKFGMEPAKWSDFLEAYGWMVIEDIGYDEIAEKCVKPTGRVLSMMPIERIVYAEKR
jgi:methyltransferase (TIGR00027 family)